MLHMMDVLRTAVLREQCTCVYDVCVCGVTWQSSGQRAIPGKLRQGELFSPPPTNVLRDTGHFDDTTSAFLKYSQRYIYHRFIVYGFFKTMAPERHLNCITFNAFKTVG